MDEQVILFHPEQGLCNRIKVIFSVLRIEADVSRPVYIVWTRGSHIDEDFYSIFKFDFPLIKLIEIQPDNFQGNGINNIGSKYIFRLGITEEDDLHEGFEKVNGIECIDFEYEKIPMVIREKYLPYFKALKPSEALKKRIDTVSFINEQYVSVHVRLDDVWRRHYRGNERDINEYFRIIDEYPQDTCFFLASCDGEVALKFKRRYGDRIFELPDKDYKGLMDAAADLFLLSRGSEIIGVYGSTFTEVAWWLSGCSQKVRIIGTQKDWVTGGGVPRNFRQKIKADIKSLVRKFYKWK